VQRWWRVVAAYRVLALAYTVAVAASGAPPYRHHVVGGVVLAALAVWTVVITVWSLRSREVPPALVIADVVVAAVAILLTPLAVARSDITSGAATLPGPWAAAPVLAAAVSRGVLGGIAAGLVLGAADIAERAGLTQNTGYGAVLLVLVGGLGGYVVLLARRAEAATAGAARLEAATAERERLARDIHDSVLQVLALVARRGVDLGGDAAELGRLAGEQEIALRRLIATPLPVVDAHGEVDVRALLEPLGRDRVTVSCPATPVPLTRGRADELAAAVRAALANVERHAGTGAQAWVLVEAHGDSVVVNIRDDGIGFHPSQLADAARDGRLGVAQSILGRMQSVGGSAHVDSTPGAGTEVELRVPRR
jgi:signal transduction histidine kinase